MSATEQITPEIVVEWLRRHPDLLQQYPELVGQLDLPGREQTASLLQHRLLKLRAQNEQLEAQLQQLTTIAGENERLMQRLHQLTLEVMSTPSDNAFIERMLTLMERDFSIEELRLHLFDPHPALDEHPGVITHHGDRPEWMEQLLARGQTYCGRLTRQKLATLFPEAEPAVASCAVIPLGGSGLLAVGAMGEDYFRPDMGTLFLELLGNTIIWRLRLMERDDRKRA